jgi:hypothetical protein
MFAQGERRNDYPQDGQRQQQIFHVASFLRPLFDRLLCSFLALRKKLLTAENPEVNAENGEKASSASPLLHAR